jgi:hypothetical protein
MTEHALIGTDAELNLLRQMVEDGRGTEEEWGRCRHIGWCAHIGSVCLLCRNQGFEDKRGDRG